MYKYIQIFFLTLDNNHKKQLFIISFMIFFSVFFDTIGIGMIIPIVNLLIENNLTEKFPYVINVIEVLGNPSQKQLLVYFVIFFLLIFIIKNIFFGILTWIKSDFIFSIANFYANKLLKKYLNKSYTFHVNNNSSKLTNILINETSLASGQFILALIDLSIEFLLLFALFLLLVIVEPIATLVMLLIFSLSASIYYFIVKQKILRFGYLRQKTNTERLKLYKEILINIKFHIIYQKTKKIIKAVNDNLENIKVLNTRYIFLQNFPRLLFEVLIILIFSFFIIGFVYIDNLKLENLLPSLALFSAAAFRMLPSINKILQRLQNLKYARSAIELISIELDYKDKLINKDNKIDKNFVFEKLSFKNVSFRYENKKEFIFENTSFEIKKGKIYGIIGTTGSGKTTMTDLIMGLHNIEKGHILLNDTLDLIKEKVNWQKFIGYVPQKIFLQDDTIKNNIAFGEFEDEINEEDILKSIKLAQLNNFINNLKDGYNSKVGEDGSKLSGGQIQRIGIARALYINPDILILDEITSSLDSITEKNILNDIKTLKKDKTIILVTHKLSTLEICDEIFQVKDQQIIEKKIHEIR